MAETLGIAALDDPDDRKVVATVSLLSFAASFAGSLGTMAETSSVPFDCCVSGLTRFAPPVAVERSLELLSGRAICEEMIAGSTGAPATVGLPVGRRRAGGMYLLP